ncbi:aldo/keto reductase [Haloparvum sp. PAK95]|uniref:aldo/keto reductase n=1 Tax=Haloparvum sp. PAK95 TaxID=3418962 RepID=UPI003D2EC06A
MEYTRLGKTGIEVSEVCFGTWRFGKESSGVVETTREEAHDLLDAAEEHGINFIDTANTYGGGDSERWIGEWLDERDREDYVIASKVYWSNESRFSANLSPKNVRAEIEGTLDRLGTDYVDLYYIHRFDDGTDVERTLATLNDLVREGKVRALGASSMAAWKLTKALWKADARDLQPFDVTQPMFHAARDETIEDYLDLCADQDLAVCPYSPLAGGLLTGKYERAPDGEVIAPDDSRGSLFEEFGEYYASSRAWDVLDEIESVASDLDATPAQVALRWLIEQREFQCIPIVGARTPDQLAENAGAAEISLSDAQYERIADARQA